MCLSLALVLAGAVAFPQAPVGAVYGWLRAYSGKEARGVARDPLFSALVQLTIPTTAISMGRDRTLASDFTTMTSNSTDKVELRDDRFLTFSGYRADGGLAQDFFWADLQQDRAFAAMYVCLGPSGGCEKQLLILSRREPLALHDSTELPPDFENALRQWLRKHKLPSPLARRFIGATGENILLQGVQPCTAASADRDAARCHAYNREASELDLAAAVLRARLDATIAGEQDEAAWLQQRDAACASSSDPDCASRQNEQRAALLLKSVPSPRRIAPAASSAAVGIAPGPVTRAHPIYTPDPGYTDAARQAHIEGEVRATLQVGADGRVSNVVLENQLGYGLDEEAEKALLQWRFQPATRAGVPIATSLEVILTFRLGPRLALSRIGAMGTPARRCA